MMRALIMEDEPLARRRLIQTLMRVAPEIRVGWEADSLESALKLGSEISPDVIFTDIQLGDGSCFDYFTQFPPACPVIFITAYDEHALKAFRVNAVDYLLKPLKEEELAAACRKLTGRVPPSGTDYGELGRQVTGEVTAEKRFLIRYGEQLRTIRTSEIAYIYTVHKAVFFVLHTGKEYPCDHSLDTLEKELDPRQFFRINRQFIVGISAIGPMSAASKSRVRIELIPPFSKEEVIVSTERSPLFKAWLGKR
jgi:two-component system, LytTR family, response regulator LytT